MYYSGDSCFIKDEFYSQRMSAVKPSPTLAVAAQAKKMQAQGMDVVDMSLGEPDFSTPDNIKHAAIEGIKNGNNKYTEVGGTMALKGAIVKRINEDYKIEVATDNVIASVGAKHSLFNIMAATLNAGDEVIIIKPYWVSYPDMVIMAGGTPVFCDCNPETLAPDINSLRKIINQKTKWIIINSPSNPSGVVYSATDLRAIADVLLEHPQVNIISDDVYSALIYDGAFLNLGHIEPLLWPRIVIVSAVSKSYAMTGWRLGYAVGHPTLIKKMTAIQSQMTSCPSSITQIAATEALSGDQSAIGHFVEVFRKRRDLAMAILKEAKGLQTNLPHGAFYIFSSCAPLAKSGSVKDDTEFASILLNQYLVSTVPGSAFGAPNHIRLSYAMADQDLVRGCERIVQACKELG